jgi:hypothetical protein
MSFSRRRFLSLSLSTGLVASLGVNCKSISGRTPDQPDQLHDTLAAYLDTLIPADEFPSATQLGVGKHLVADTETDGGYRQLIEKGCEWLDAQAEQYGAARFAALSQAQREQVVSLAAAGKAGLLAHMFFDRMQADAFAHYYAHPQSWRALGYPGPPQPEGFMNYTQAPIRRSM